MNGAKKALMVAFALLILSCYACAGGSTPGTTTTTATDKTKKNEAESKTFASDPGEVTLAKKDAAATVSFKNGEPKAVTSTADVKAEVKDKTVVFTQLIDAPAEAKVVEFTVKGGKDGAEEAKIKVTLSKKS